LPTLAHALGGSDSLIAFLPMAMIIGYGVPPLFTAHLFERMGRLMPTLKVSGPVQRLPYAIAALTLWFAGKDSPGVALVAVALAPLVCGLVGGITVAAWFRLTAVMVPGTRRSSGSAMRNMIAAFAGIGAGFAVQAIFSRLPGPPGFAVLHAVAFAILMLSYAVFCFSEEPDFSPLPSADHRSLTQQLRSIPGILRADRNFRFYAVGRVCGNLVYVTIPFMAIHAAKITGAGPALAGNLLAWQMGGSIVGNTLGGWMGDRFGSRSVLLTSYVAALAMLIVCVTSTGAGGFCFAFALWGMAASLQMIGDGTFLAEQGFGRRMPTYVSLSALASLTGMLASGATGSLLRHLTEGIVPLVAVSVVGVGLALLLFVTVIREPRRRGPHQTSLA
jgi:MFS family permease